MAEINETYRLVGTKTQNGDVVQYVLRQNTNGNNIYCNVQTFFYLLGKGNIQNVIGVRTPDGIIARGNGIQIKNLPQIEIECGQSTQRTTQRTTQNKSIDSPSSGKLNNKSKLDVILASEIQQLNKDTYGRVDTANYERDAGTVGYRLNIGDARKEELKMLDILTLKIAHDLYKRTKQKINRVQWGKVTIRGARNTIYINTESVYRLAVVDVIMKFTPECDYFQIEYTGPAVNEAEQANNRMIEDNYLTFATQKLNSTAITGMTDYVHSRMMAANVY